MIEKPRFLMCICTGQCPGFASLNLWELINYVRGELDVEYAIVHPQLCVDAGGNYDDQVVPLDLRNMSTKDAMNKVKETVEGLKVKSGSKEVS
jgi:hypothetical protein